MIASIQIAPHPFGAQKPTYLAEGLFLVCEAERGEIFEKFVELFDVARYIGREMPRPLDGPLIHGVGDTLSVLFRAYDTFRIFRFDELLTLGIGLYDDRKVAIGAYNETGEGDHIAMLVSSNEAVVKWGEELYNSYRAQATHAIENPPETAR